VNGMPFRKLSSCHSLRSNILDKKLLRAASVRERFQGGGRTWPN